MRARGLKSRPRGKTAETRYVKNHGWKGDQRRQMGRAREKRAGSCSKEIEQTNRIAYRAKVKVGTKKEPKVDQTKPRATTLRRGVTTQLTHAQSI